MDPETYATFVDFFDRTTSPKRGGVRFVQRAAVDKAQRIEDDARDYKQLASDALIHFLVLGADADPSVMVGSGAPSIRITVAEPALRSGVGFGRIDGQSGVVSIDTVKRMLCDAKALRAGFDSSGTYIELFEDPLAENRLYNSRQREILAAKFGGCMDPNCDRPPSWCEAHHIQFVKRDGGKTTIQQCDPALQAPSPAVPQSGIRDLPGRLRRLLEDTADIRRSRPDPDRNAAENPQSARPSCRSRTCRSMVLSDRWRR